MKKVIFSLLCLVMIPLSGFADDTNTQTNTSGSNTNITGGYTTTNNNTYQSGSSNDTTNTLQTILLTLQQIRHKILE